MYILCCIIICLSVNLISQQFVLCCLMNVVAYGCKRHNLAIVDVNCSLCAFTCILLFESQNETSLLHFLIICAYPIILTSFLEGKSIFIYVGEKISHLRDWILYRREGEEVYPQSNFLRTLPKIYHVQRQGKYTVSVHYENSDFAKRGHFRFMTTFRLG